MKLVVLFYLIACFTAMFLKPSALMAQQGADISDLRFSDILLNNPRDNSGMLIRSFSYQEIPEYPVFSDSSTVFLTNGYAGAVISDPFNYLSIRDLHSVHRIDIVYTKYPFHKKDWLTNYYDLLAWRLKALFEIDPELNNDQIEWNLVAQTSCKTARQAKELFHGIVLHLEPLPDLTDQGTQPEVPDTDTSSIKNGGFLFSSDRDPEFFRSHLNFTPIPGKEPRLQMDPKKLKCPTWK